MMCFIVKYDCTGCFFYAQCKHTGVEKVQERNRVTAQSSVPTCPALKKSPYVNTPDCDTATACRWALRRNINAHQIVANCYWWLIARVLSCVSIVCVALYVYTLHCIGYYWRVCVRACVCIKAQRKLVWFKLLFCNHLPVFSCHCCFLMIQSWHIGAVGHRGGGIWLMIFYVRSVDMSLNVYFN